MKNEFDRLKADFNENGFVIVEDFLDAAQVENLCARVWKRSQAI